jgi:hypothetical protein
MIFAVYFMSERDDNPIIVATFLMQSDAERFIKSFPYETGFKVTELKTWDKSWPEMVIEIKESLENV